MLFYLYQTHHHIDHSGQVSWKATNPVFGAIGGTPMPTACINRKIRTIYSIKGTRWERLHRKRNIEGWFFSAEISFAFLGRPCENSIQIAYSRIRYSKDYVLWSFRVPRLSIFAQQEKSRYFPDIIFYALHKYVPVMLCKYLNQRLIYPRNFLFYFLHSKCRLSSSNQEWVVRWACQTFFTRHSKSGFFWTCRCRRKRKKTRSSWWNLICTHGGLHTLWRTTFRTSDLINDLWGARGVEKVRNS